jgi:integrase
MKVALRQRQKNKKISLYLDYYHKGKRKYEYLRLYLNPKPKNAEERAVNKKTLQLAENIRAKRQLELQNGIYGFQDVDKINSGFLTYFEVLMEKRQESDGNYGNWKSTLKHLKNYSKKELKFSDITADWLEDFKSYLIHDAMTKQGRNLSKNSCVSYFNKVKATLKQAVKDGIITNNPALTVDGIKEVETQREFLTLEELQKAYYQKCDVPVIKQAFLFSCLTGLRFSDIQKLTWQEIQHSEDNGYYIRFRQKKTAGQETLPISEDAVKLLDKRKSPTEKVFLDLTYSDYNNQKLREWMIRSGIEKNITFHCARHTYATLQLTLGTDIYTVSKLLGHKSLKTTEIYAKIIDQKKREAANKIKLNI